MNDYTARLLRNELNHERSYLEDGQRKLRYIDEKRSQQQQWNREAEWRITALTEALEAAGASTEPGPDPFTRMTVDADA